MVDDVVEPDCMPIATHAHQADVGPGRTLDRSINKLPLSISLQQ